MIEMCDCQLKLNFTFFYSLIICYILEKLKIIGSEGQAQKPSIEVGFHLLQQLLRSKQKYVEVFPLQLTNLFTRS